MNQKLWGFVLAICVLTATDANAKVNLFRLNGVDIGIDEQTGGLVYLSTRELGTIVKTRKGEAAMVDIAYPIPAYEPMRLTSRGAAAVVKGDMEGVTITWKSLRPTRALTLPSGPVGAEVTIRAATDKRSVIFSCRITNRSVAPVPQVLFPDLDTMDPIYGMDTELRFAGGMVQPFAEPVRGLAKPLQTLARNAQSNAPFYPTDASWASYPASDLYGGINNLRWLDYGSREGGMSIFQRKWGSNDAPTIHTIRPEDEPSALRMVWDQKAEIAAGATWDSGEFWFTPHAGGWAKGIEPFRAYLREKAPARPLPRHIAEGLGCHSVMMAEELDPDPAHVAFRFQDLPGIAKEDLEYGLNEIVPWWWAAYFTFPLTARRELGGTEDLLAALREARRLGSNIAPFISIHIISSDQLLAKYGAKPHASNWTYDHAFVPRFNPFYAHGFDGSWIDSGNAAWQQDVRDELDRLMESGMYSFSWDQFSNRTEQGKDAGFIRLIEGVRKLAREKDPESTFLGENITPTGLEEDGAVLDYTWNWIEGGDDDPILNVLRAPRINWNIQDSPLLVKEAFLAGRFINTMPKKPNMPNGTARISEFPLFAAALKESAGLHTRFLPFFTDGVLLGDSFLNQVPRVFVRGWQLGNKLLVLVLNDTGHKCQAFLKSDLSLWLPQTDKYVVNEYDGEANVIAHDTEVGTKWLGVTRPLEPSEIVVFEIETQR